MVEIWDRMVGESTKAYKAFCLYRDMGPDDRSYAKVGQRTGKTKQAIEKWGLRWNWVARATAYDDYTEVQTRAVQERERKAMAERHAKQAMLIQQKIIQRLQTLNPDDIPPSSITSMFEAAVRVERISRGESTENVDHTVHKPVEIVEVYRNSREQSTDAEQSG